MLGVAAVELSVAVLWSIGKLADVVAADVADESGCDTDARLARSALRAPSTPRVSCGALPNRAASGTFGAGSAGAGPASLSPASGNRPSNCSSWGRRLGRRALAWTAECCARNIPERTHCLNQVNIADSFQTRVQAQACARRENEDSLSR